MTICLICLKDTDTLKYDELDLCSLCIKDVDREKQNPRMCKPDW